MQVTFFANFCKIWAISAICIVFLIKVAILSLIGGAVMVEKLATDLIAQIFFLYFSLNYGAEYLATNSLYKYGWEKILHYYYDNSSFNNPSVGIVKIGK